MLAAMVLVMLVAGIAAGFGWYHNDKDLGDIRALARQQGRPLVWAELGLAPPTAERMAWWKRLTILSGKVTAFQSQLGPDGKTRYRPWDRIPDELRAHHAAMDPAIVTELIDLLDRLGDQPLVLHEQISFTRKLDELGVARVVIRFLQERLILAEPHEVGPLARRMLATCRRFTVDSLILHMVCTSLVDVTMQGIALRIDDLKRHDPTIAADILGTIALLHGNLLQALDGEFVLALDVVTDPGTSILSKARDEWYMPLAIRAGRHRMLNNLLEAIVGLRSRPPEEAIAWAKVLDEKVYAARAGLPTPALLLEGIFTPAWGIVVQQGASALLRGQVIAAEIQGTAWPVDTFDPGSAPLRAMKHEGRIIAAYSVHSDGVDHGGDEKRDRVFPLYAKP